MKISNSKKELARIISENGGWREGGFAAQDKTSARIDFYKEKPWINGGQSNWNGDYIVKHKMYATETISNWHQTTLSRAEYLHLYPAPDADGWIEWKGGECPVEKGALVDVIWKDGTERVGVKALHIGGAGHKFWVADGMVNDIIAYRLHRPDAVKPTDFGAIGDDETNPAAKEGLESMEYRPTIEQLAADYRNAKDYAERKQQEADDAKADADEAMRKLELAGEAIGLTVSPITEKKEPELVITDWRDLRVGDEIEVFNFECHWSESSRKQELMSGPCVVMRAEVGDVHIELKKNLPTNGPHWNATGVDACDFKFIRRP